MPYAIWVRGVEGKKLVDPIIKGHDAKGLNFVAQAREAVLHVDMAERKLSITMRIGRAMSVDGQEDVSFESKTVDVLLPPSFGKESDLRPRDMTWNEMLARRKKYRGLRRDLQEGDRRTHPRRRFGRHADPLPSPDGLPDDAPPERTKDLKQLQFEDDYIHQQILWLNVELLMRPALSVGCFCFILVGCPVGIWLSRSDYLSAFIVSFLPIVLVYYPLMLCGTGLAKEAHGPRRPGLGRQPPHGLHRQSAVLAPARNQLSVRAAHAAQRRSGRPPLTSLRRAAARTRVVTPATTSSPPRPGTAP